MSQETGAIFSFVSQVGKIMRHSKPILTKNRKIKKLILFLRMLKHNQLLSALTHGVCSFHFRLADWKNYVTLDAITH